MAWRRTASLGAAEMPAAETSRHTFPTIRNASGTRAARRSPELAGTETATRRATTQSSARVRRNCALLVTTPIVDSTESLCNFVTRRVTTTASYFPISTGKPQYCSLSWSSLATRTVLAAPWGGASARLQPAADFSPPSTSDVKTCVR